MRAIMAPFGVVEDVPTGGEGLARYHDALVAEQPFQLVCLDLGLPDASGLEILKAMRVLEASVGLLAGQGAKVLVITAESDKSVAMKAFRSQADGYLVKPVRRADIIARLADLGLLSATPVA